MPGSESAESPEVDELYGLALEEFTAARNALAKQLKKAGDADAAAEVAGLAKPPKAAWAINQLARSGEKEVERLLQAGEEVRSAQEAAMSGDAGSLRGATSALGAAVARVTELAVALAGEAQRDRIASTLRAAAVDEAAGALIRAGRLDHEVESTGFGLGLITVPDELPPPRARAAKKAKPKPDPRLRREADRLAEEADRLEAAAEKAVAAAQRARRAADEAEQRASGAEADEDEA